MKPKLQIYLKLILNDSLYIKCKGTDIFYLSLYLIKKILKNFEVVLYFFTTYILSRLKKYYNI